MIEAQVVPVSQIVMRGSPYEARIVLSAIDSTKLPKIVVNGTTLSTEAKGRYTVNTSSSGTFPIEGFVEMPNSDGSILRRNFKTEYFVTEPGATIAPTLMNVLYAGIDNPVRIAVPGIPSGSVYPTMSNGALTRKGESLWDARPSAGAIGQEAVITIVAEMTGGRRVQMATTPFRIKMLPDPMPYLEYKDENGNIRKFRGGTIAKRSLMETDGILAAIDDDILNIQFDVQSFELIYPDQFGNMINEPTAGSNFSERQKNYIRGLARGKQFWVNRVKAKGPDGVERQIPPIQVIVN